MWLGYEREAPASVWLPHKIWNECVRCPLFPNCQEVALVRTADPERFAMIAAHDLAVAEALAGGEAPMGFIPEGTRWYLADIVLEHIIEGEPRNVVHINTHLLEAESPDEAYEKAVGLGRHSEQEYLNTESNGVRVLFRGLRALDVIHDPLEDGAEVAYSEAVGVSEVELSRWLVPKESLGIFAPRRSRQDGPNYLPESVMRSLEAEGFDRGDLEDAV